jgi:hypothetical protein
MKKVHFIPKITKKQTELKHIATKCGRCDASMEFVGGKTPIKVFVTRPKA